MWWLQLQTELLSGPALMTSADLKVSNPPQACLRGLVQKCPRVIFPGLCKEWLSLAELPAELRVGVLHACLASAAQREQYLRLRHPGGSTCNSWMVGSACKLAAPPKLLPPCCSSMHREGRHSQALTTQGLQDKASLKSVLPMLHARMLSVQAAEPPAHRSGSHPCKSSGVQRCHRAPKTVHLQSTLWPAEVDCIQAKAQGCSAVTGAPGQGQAG